MRSVSCIQSQHGFSLVTLSIWMIVLGIAAAVMLALLPNRSDQVRMDKTIATLGDAQDDVLAYIVKNSKFPTPDTNNNGTGNSGAVTGALPYRDMGLPESLLDQASLPLHYTPYRNDSVDLTDVGNLYSPALPDLSGLPAKVTTHGATADSTSLSVTTDTQPLIDQCTQEVAAVSTTPNLLDFCTALDQAAAATATLDSVNVVRCGTTSPCPPNPVAVSDIENVAYVVLSGGLENANGSGADPSLDGLNEPPGVTYEDPARGRGKGYDDIVRAVRFSTLQRELSCKAVIDSVNMLASVAQDQESTMEDTISAYNTAETEVTMASVSVLMDAIGVFQVSISIPGIVEDIGESAGGCASIVLSADCCPALAGNIAALVVYTVTAIAQIVGLVVDIAALANAIQNRDTFLYHILPEVNAHLCSAILETVAADARGGLATTPVAGLVTLTPATGYPLVHPTYP
jgi:type II secretory pathway pseudopilin PulG